MGGWSPHRQFCMDNPPEIDIAGAAPPEWCLGELAGRTDSQNPEWLYFSALSALASVRRQPRGVIATYWPPEAIYGRAEWPVVVHCAVLAYFSPNSSCHYTMPAAMSKRKYRLPAHGKEVLPFQPPWVRIFCEMDIPSTTWCPLP
jgi:hypothetical protein